VGISSEKKSKIRGKVFSINLSQKKGVGKKAVEEGYLKEGWGLLRDAHSGHWHRQVSLLSWERIREQKVCPKVKKSEERGFKPGDFAENITTEGLSLATLKIGDKIEIGESIRLKVTQIGKRGKMTGIILAGGKSRRMKKAQRIAYSVGYLSSIFI